MRWDTQVEPVTRPGVHQPIRGILLSHLRLLIRLHFVFPPSFLTKNYSKQLCKGLAAFEQPYAVVRVECNAVSTRHSQHRMMVGITYRKPSSPQGKNCLMPWLRYGSHMWRNNHRRAAVVGRPMCGSSCVYSCISSG